MQVFINTKFVIINANFVFINNEGVYKERADF